MQARRVRTAVSSSLSYGLVLHLLLLSTTHRCVAVAFGYGPESVCPKRTLTSLTTRAFRRTCHELCPVVNHDRCYKELNFDCDARGLARGFSRLLLLSRVEVASIVIQPRA